MKLLRLSGRKVCERVKMKGMLWKGKHFHARLLRGAPRTAPESIVPSLFVGVLTSTKLDKSAVKRNRMRRRCREALRVRMKDSVREISGSYQLLLIPRSSSLSSPFDEILSDVDRLLASLT